MSDDTTEFYLEMGTTRSGGTMDDLTISLKIEDAVSGEVMVYIRDLSPADMWRLIQGGTFRAKGQRSQHLDRVGRKLRTESVELGRMWGSGGKSGSLDTDAARANAEAAMHKMWPDHVNGKEVDQRIWVRQSNSGWTAIRHTWEDPS